MKANILALEKASYCKGADRNETQHLPVQTDRDDISKYK